MESSILEAQSGLRDPCTTAAGVRQRAKNIYCFVLSPQLLKMNRLVHWGLYFFPFQGQVGYVARNVRQTGLPLSVSQSNPISGRSLCEWFKFLWESNSFLSLADSNCLVSRIVCWSSSLNLFSASQGTVPQRTLVGPSKSLRSFLYTRRRTQIWEMVQKRFTQEVFLKNPIPLRCGFWDYYSHSTISENWNPIPQSNPLRKFLHSTFRISIPNFGCRHSNSKSKSPRIGGLRTLIVIMGQGWRIHIF